MRMDWVYFLNGGLFYEEKGIGGTDFVEKLGYRGVKWIGADI